MNCLKCNNDFFINRGKSSYIDSIEYVLCGTCGNVMIIDENEHLLPTPEHDSKLTKLMMIDAAKAFNSSLVIAAISEEDKEALEEYLNECYCNDCCDDCCDCCCDIEEGQEEEITGQDFVDLLGQIVADVDDPKLTKVWNQTSFEDIQEVINEYCDTANISKNDIFGMAKLMTSIIPKQVISKEISEEVKKVFSDMDNEACINVAEQTPSITLSRVTEEKASYIVTEAGKGWRKYNNVTKEELMRLINNDDSLEMFEIYEVKPVDYKSVKKIEIL